MSARPQGDSDVLSVRRVAILSVHTCPLDQPGVGDSGGMNVYVRSVARRLAEMGVEVDLFTRAAGPDQAIVEIDPGVRVVHLTAGPPRPVEKEELPRYLYGFVSALLLFAAGRDPSTGGHPEEATLGTPAYDAIHSHYWLSGWVGHLAAERWGVPLVHSFHTLGRVKNRTLEHGESPEPSSRIAGEERVAQTADVLLAPTPDEAADLVRSYGARPERVRIVPPGVESSLFTPGDRAAARRALGIDGGSVVLFVGRLQALKRPDAAVRAVAELAARRPDLDPRLVVVGGPSGRGGIIPEDLARLAAGIGAGSRLRVLPPVPHGELPDLYRASDVVIVPSRTESFGLVALEAASCGIPVVATDVGGLRTTVRDGVTGILVPGAEPAGFAGALERVLSDRASREAMGAAGRRLARRFDWRQAAAGLLAVYEESVQSLEPAGEASG